MQYFVLLLPILQFGFSWWINVSTLACLLILIKLRIDRVHIKSLVLSPYIALVFLMYLTYLSQDFGNIHSFLRVSREALVLLLMLLLMGKFEKWNTSELNLKFDNVLLLISFCELFLVIIQFIGIKKGIWFGPSSDWFAGRGNVIPTILDLRYSKIRPSGTFSEPSYLGIICISLMMMSGFNKRLNKKNFMILYLNYLIIILSQSKSALLFGSILLFLHYKRSDGGIKFYYRSLIVPIFVILSLLNSVFLLGILSSSKGSLSIQNRIFRPFEMLFGYLMSNPLGSSFYKRIYGLADNVSGLTWESVLHNSFFNLIFSYGIVGFFLIFGILRFSKRDKIVLLYLVSAMLQNGSFLDFDKLYLVFFTISIYRLRVRNIFANHKVDS